MISTSVLLEQLRCAREALQSQFDHNSICSLAKLTDELGYRSAEELKRLGVDTSAFLRAAIDFHRQFLKHNPEDGIVLNNLGVLIANSGNMSEARPIFLEAVSLLPYDRNAHENLNIADAYLGNERVMPKVDPKQLRANEETLLAYFDPQAM
jgi:tetratricopeptide (TPR) repeat protein